MHEKSNLFFSGKTKKTITNLSSAELTQKVVKIKECNMPHANRKDLNQHTHPNAEIAGDQPTTLNGVHCEKIIYTKHMSLVPVDLVQSCILFHSLLR